MKPTVVCTSELPDIALQLLSQESEVIVHPAMGVRSEDELVDIFVDGDAVITLVTDKVSRRVLEVNPNLRVVSNFGVGVNNIDLDAARALDIIVTNTPGVLTDATADLTVALILALTRRLVEGDRMVRRGEFHGWHPLMLRGASLQGKQLGIIGLGRIGTAVARRCTAFGMSVRYTNRNRNEEAERELGATRVALDELLQTSDVVSIHAPLTSETHHLLDATALGLMKESAYLINTARGPIVDELALARALIERRIAGAGLDVYEREPRVEVRLLELDNVVLLPHIGSATVEARNEMARLAALNALLVLRGSAPLHRVV